MLTGRLGPYSLIRQIAVGGMAEIYLAVAEENEPRHQFAIKVIHQQNADDPDFVRMLVDEARLAVQLKHPNIVTTYDLGLANDQYYIVMEHVEGADLFRLQQRAADQRLSFPIPLAAYITREVARGLDYAHKLRDTDGQPLQVVHRDISPQNVLLGHDGSVKITDFGIAKAARRAAQTQAGIIKGKYYYMSPEQASGQPIDGRTDIFAAGILLYEMLIGEMLYYDEDVDRLLQLVRKADIPPVTQRRSDTPLALERILMKALHKDPDERYQTAGEYGQALDTYLRRYSPLTGASDIGAFLDRLVGERARRRALHEATASMPVTADGFGDSATEHTVGLTTEQISQLGIRDENSLIFRPKEQLAALLQGSSSSAELTSSSSGADVAPSRDEEALIKTTQRQMEGSNPARRGSSSGTMEVMVPSLRPGGGPPMKSSSARRDADTTPVPPESEDASPQDAAAGDGPRRARETLRSHSFSSRAPRPVASPPSEVFRAIEPDLEEELMAGAAAVAPAPYALTGSRKLVGSFPRHEPITAQLSNGEVTVPRAEVPPELLAALLPGADERGAAKKPGGAPPRSQPSAVPRPTSSNEPSAKVELLQSDLAFSDPSLLAVGPSVELAQSDSNFPDPRASGQGSHVDPGMSDESVQDASLDAISAESTHHNLSPPPKRPGDSQQAAPVEPLPVEEAPPPHPTGSSEPIVRAAAPPRLWPFWVSGIGAALLSAGLTWYLTGPGAHRGVSSATGADLLHAELIYPTLVVPEGGEPAAEPSPAGESGPPATPATPTTNEPDAGEIALSSEPPGAEVYINKKLMGQTPLTLRELATDKDIKVELRLAGHTPLRKHIKWKGKTALTVLVKLHPEDQAGPGGATPGPTAPSGEGSPPASGEN